MGIKVEDINLTDWEFWSRPWEERDAAFRALRAQSALPFYEEPEMVIVPRGRATTR